MRKNAVVYDKWLSSLGGGEVVACNIAKILADNGYDVIFIAGKKIDIEIIKDRLNVDLSNISMVEIWSDESKIKQLSKDKDLFVNISFIDYTYGCAKKNIYYTLFPKEPYNSIGEKLFTFLLPFITKFINPIEMISDYKITAITKSVNYSEPAYLLEEKNKIAIPYLQKDKVHNIEFSLYFHSFSQSLISGLTIEFDEAKIIDKKFSIDHYHNQMDVQFSIKPLSSTAYLKIDLAKIKESMKKEPVFLLYPKTSVSNIYDPFLKIIYNKINNKLRAGVFSNPLERLKSYQVILADSTFTKKWIRNYWKRESTLLYPPVELLFKQYKIDDFKKKKWICSVGRFFKLGHGKKQDALIKAFKKFHDSGHKDWQLHLVGGIGNDSVSVEIIEGLRKESENYPIFFHLNASRKKVEEIYLNSRIYWHATGFGENENTNPIKFEHFGIAPIEAISAKCIPILFDGGGLRETIYKSGFSERNLYKTINELVDNTIYYIDHGNEIDWKEVFSRINSEFSISAFQKNLLAIVDED